MQLQYARPQHTPTIHVRPKHTPTIHVRPKHTPTIHVRPTVMRQTERTIMKHTRFYEDEAKALQEAARVKQVSMTQYIREAVAEKVRHDEDEIAF